MTEACIRCGQTADLDSDDHLEWESLSSGNPICGDCITTEERQAIDEEDMELSDTTPLGDSADPRFDA